MKFKYLGKVPLCNNRADRGIYINGFCLPLCSRCTGILTGAVAGTIILKAGKKKLSQVTGLAGVAMLVPTAVDGVVEYVYGKESTNKRRLVTGLIAGVGCTVIEIYALQELKG